MSVRDIDLSSLNSFAALTDPMPKSRRVSIRLDLFAISLLCLVFLAAVARAEDGAPTGGGATEVGQQSHGWASTGAAGGTGVFKSWIFLPSAMIYYQPTSIPTPIPTSTPTPTSTFTPTATPTPKPTPTSAANRIENDDSRISYRGQWTTEQAASASHGTFAQSVQVGSAAELIFSGDSFTLRRTVGVEFGQAAVTIDGQYLGLLQSNFIEMRYQVPAYFDNLGPGEHSLSLDRPFSPIQGPQAPAISLDVITVPSHHAPSPAQTRAVQQINHYRQLVGIPPVTGLRSIHEAAQHHAEFYMNHRHDPRMPQVGFHGEISSLPGYTGFQPSQRANYFGYLGVVGEVGNFLGDPIAGVDTLMDTVYHRCLLLDYSYSDVGYGMVNDQRGAVDVIDIGFTQTSLSVPASRTIYVYPIAGQQDVPPGWNGAEVPDPLPGLPRPVGFPISLHIAQPQARALTAAAPFDARATATQVGSRPDGQGVTESAILFDGSGNQVPIYLLDGQTDPNGWFSDGNTIFLVPTAPLQPHSTYRVSISGRDSQGVHFSRSWKFVTGAAE